jgi:hypothetical protein
MGMEEHTCLHSERTGKGRRKKKKKTLVLTLGNPPKKGGKKKNPSINPRQPVGKGREKKNPGINPGQRHLKYTEADFAIENAEVGSAIECKARIDEAQNMMKHPQELGDFQLGDFRNELQWRWI